MLSPRRNTLLSRPSSSLRACLRASLTDSTVNVFASCSRAVCLRCLRVYVGGHGFRSRVPALFGKLNRLVHFLACRLLHLRDLFGGKDALLQQMLLVSGNRAILPVGCHFFLIAVGIEIFCRMPGPTTGHAF